MIIFTNQTTEHLRRGLAEPGVRFGRFRRSQFANGEWRYEVLTEVKGRDVTLVASVWSSPDTLFELIALCQAIADQKPRRFRLVVPFLGYARQDRPFPREGALGIRLAKIISDLPADEIVVVDVHSDAIRRALPRAKELSALPLFAKKFGNKIDVIIAPDRGALKIVRRLQKLLPVKTGYVEKTRPRPNVAVARALHGDVSGKRVLLLDDMIDTGGTINAAAALVKRQGAKSIMVAATHGILTRRPRLPIIVTNTLPVKPRRQVKVIDISHALLSPKTN